ncbi:cytochrome c oxidase assembly protein [Couchioplanes caeruleus]|uniref:cytochrome c oxidase assembly protein n=1 Tax=Couchioplanes caeruleus TaxID=56438 RepID=UPI0020C0B9DA|nr:cytochrome c oxidase assembly protein [Couchioplanes caeruleus]UQU62618.1 cytochrome c oxidase assembly protein [Couchioplanes caeruleus]
MSVTTTAVVLAHGDAGGADAWTEVAALLALAGVGAAYGRGVHELWARRGRGAVVSRWRAAAFVAGLVVVLLAQRGPVHELAEGSFAGHMVQHMILMLGAGPLLACGGAGLPLSLAAPRRLRAVVARLRSGPAGRWLRRPLNLALVAAGVHTAVLWWWHLPRPYGWAEHHAVVHGAEHASFLAAAWLLWSTVLAPHANRLGGPASFLLLFATGMPAAALGAVLTLASGPIYPPGTLAGPDPLADQQLAGLVMWVPMDVVMLVAAVALFLRWMLALDRSSPAGRDLRPRREEIPA